MALSIKKLFQPIDLTKGKPWKVLLIFWIPIVLSYLFQQSYTLIDELICGHYLANQFVTGIDDTNSLVFLVLQFAFGCSAGFSVVSAAKKGENDYEGLRKSFVTQLLLAAIISIILTAIAVPCVDLLLNAVGMAGADSYTYLSAKVFTTTIYAGLFTQIFYNLICAFLRSIGDSFTPFLFLAGSTILSVGLDFLFIAGIPSLLPNFGLYIDGMAGGGYGGGVFGAALSVNIAQFLAAFGCIVYALKKYPYLMPKKGDFKLSWKFVWEHLKLGLPLAFQFSILAIGLIVLQNNIVNFDIFSKGYASLYGKPFVYNGITYSPIASGANGEASYNLVQTAFGPSNKFETFLETTLDAFGAAMLAYCSQNRGSRQYGRIKKGLNQGFIIGAIICTCIALIELLSSINGGFLYLFLKPEYITPAVINYAQTYFYFIAPSTYLLGVLFIVRSSIQGLGKSLFPLISGCLELVARIFVSILFPGWLVSTPIAINVFNSSDVVTGQIESIHYGNAYYSVCLAHPFAWILALIPCLVALIYYIYNNKLEVIDTKKYGKTGPIL